MEKKMSIFEKIINWFKNLFQKQETKLLEENAPSIETKAPAIEASEELEAYIEENLGEYEPDKDEFFELYSDVKSQNIDIQELATEELIDFNRMAEKEIELKTQKLKEQKEANKMLKQEVEALSQKEKILQSKMIASNN